jgi:hypothetical protein
MGDILAGEGVAVIDPHGDLALDILDAIPRSRINDVCYLDVTDDERPVGLNPITRITPERRALAAAGVVSAFKHLWSDSWGPRLEHFLFHGVASILRQFDSTATAALEEPNPIQHDTPRPVMNPSCRIDLRYVNCLGFLRDLGSALALNVWAGVPPSEEMPPSALGLRVPCDRAA